MVKFFSILALWPRRRSAAGPSLQEEEEARWRLDPLAHPHLARMDMRQLADLPAAAARQAEERVTDRDREVAAYSAARRPPRKPPDCLRQSCA